MGLPWVRLDSHIGSHDKILRLLTDPSPKKWQAAFSYTCALGWSGDQGTDGMVPIVALPFIHGTTTTGRLLVKYDLWDELRNGQGWQIRNYTERQQTNAIATAKREMKRISGEKGNCRRWHGETCWTPESGCSRD
jgi:hypothetical protein